MQKQNGRSCSSGNDKLRSRRQLTSSLNSISPVRSGTAAKCCPQLGGGDGVSISSRMYCAGAIDVATDIMDIALLPLCSGVITDQTHRQTVVFRWIKTCDYIAGARYIDASALTSHVARMTDPGVWWCFEHTPHTCLSSLVQIFCAVTVENYNTV